MNIEKHPARVTWRCSAQRYTDGLLPLSAKSPPGPASCITVGFVVRDTHEELTLATSVFRDDCGIVTHMQGVTIIPQNQIDNIMVLDAMACEIPSNTLSPQEVL